MLLILRKDHCFGHFGLKETKNSLSTIERVLLKVFDAKLVIYIDRLRYEGTRDCVDKMKENKTVSILENNRR